MNLRRWRPATSAKATAAAPFATRPAASWAWLLRARTAGLRSLLDLAESDLGRDSQGPNLSACVSSFRLCVLAGWNRRQHEHSVAPDDWRRMALTRDFDFPFHVLGLAPFGGRIAPRRDSVLKRSAPLRPIL